MTCETLCQEVWHRYHTSARRDAIAAAFEAILGVVDEVFSVDLDDVERARQVLLSHDQLSARDSLHAAIMERHGVHRVLSFDGGFDEISSLVRLPNRHPDS